jgi:hypothetical protein
MICFNCNNKNGIRFIRSDDYNDGQALKRWYECKDCGSTFSTLEAYIRDKEEALIGITKMITEIKSKFDTLEKEVIQIFPCYPSDMRVKRKRGRPRKDSSLTH